MKLRYLSRVWGLFYSNNIEHEVELRRMKDKNGRWNNGKRKFKGEGRGSRIGRKPTTCNHIHVCQALNNELCFPHGDHQLPAGKQLIGAPRNTAPHISLMPPSNTCTLPYHFKIHILSKLCLTSTTCACPCTSSPFPGYNSMWDFPFFIHHLSWARSIFTLVGVGFL